MVQDIVVDGKGIFLKEPLRATIARLKQAAEAKAGKTLHTQIIHNDYEELVVNFLDDGNLVEEMHRFKDRKEWEWNE